MTTQRQRIRATSIAAKREAQLETSIGAAENEGLPVIEPTTGFEFGLAPVLATHASEAFRPAPAPPLVVNALRQFGSSRSRSKWGPVR